ncbi:glycoside hydrolase family 92 protein [Bacteroides thetaiotaomicron]|nr:glycoside hydrolase family 92 protein [Bacteroides thetaiotaomicron]
MIEWVGQDSLRLQLTYFFDHHLYNQGNEPDIHVPYLFNRLGSTGENPADSAQSDDRTDDP